MMELSALVAALMMVLLIAWVAIVLWATVLQVDAEARTAAERDRRS